MYIQRFNTQSPGEQANYYVVTYILSPSVPDMLPNQVPINPRIRIYQSIYQFNPRVSKYLINQARGPWINSLIDLVASPAICRQITLAGFNREN